MVEEGVRPDEVTTLESRNVLSLLPGGELWSICNVFGIYRTLYQGTVCWPGGGSILRQVQCAVCVQTSRFLEDHDIGNLLILKSIYKLDLNSLFDAWHLELVCFLYLDTSSVRSWLGDLTIEISRYPIDIGDLGNLFLGRDA